MAHLRDKARVGIRVNPQVSFDFLFDFLIKPSGRCRQIPIREHSHQDVQVWCWPAGPPGGELDFLIEFLIKPSGDLGSL